MSIIVNIEKKLPSFKLEVSIKQEKGIIGFLGESGSGKSMTLKCIAGLETPDNGLIVINNKVLFDSKKNINLSTQDRKVGFLFQNYALFPHMNVIKNIEMGLHSLKKEDKKLASKEYVNRFYLSGLEKMYPWQLSGGQQQRVAIARALATSPDILLLDEPFSALDYHLRRNMERELLNILEDYEENIIFVTHDIKEAYRISDNIVVFDKGKAISNREKEDLFKNPKCLTEARITGCKNISKVTKISKNIMYANDWGYEFKINYEKDKEYKYIGIREHNINVVKSNDDFNTKLFKVSKIIDNPFSNTIYVVNEKNEDYKYIKFDISKKEVFFEIGDEILLEFNENNMFIF